jgi:hypothetical protein
MRRFFLLPLACAALTQADAPQEVIDLFASMASALSESNPSVFLRAIDPSMPGYGRFAAAIEALATQNSLSNSIEITKQEGDDRVQVVELDWLLEITGKSDSHVFVRREALVKCRLERRKKKWRIVAIDPPAFFDPPSSDAVR